MGCDSMFHFRDHRDDNLVRPSGPMPENHAAPSCQSTQHEKILTPMHLLTMSPPQGCRDPVCVQQHHSAPRFAPGRCHEPLDDGPQRRHRRSCPVHDHGARYGLHGARTEILGKEDR